MVPEKKDFACGSNCITHIRLNFMYILTNVIYVRLSLVLF